MKVRIDLGGYEFFADLSGSEVEVVTRVFAKAMRGSFVTMEQSDDSFVPNEQWKSGLKISTTEADLRSHDEVNSHRAEVDRKQRAAYVAAYFDLKPGDDSTEAVKDIQNKLYYDGFIKYNDRADWAFERSAVDALQDVMVFCQRDSSAQLWAYADGEVVTKE